MTTLLPHTVRDMTCQFITLYYEEDLVRWLEQRFPTVEVFVVIRTDHTTYHALVSAPDADVIRSYVCKDLLPPFTRRATHVSEACRPQFEPGLLFQFDGLQLPDNVLRRTAAAYRLAVPKLSNPSHRKYVRAKLAELDAKIYECDDKPTTRLRSH